MANLICGAAEEIEGIWEDVNEAVGAASEVVDSSITNLAGAISDGIAAISAAISVVSSIPDALAALIPEEITQSAGLIVDLVDLLGSDTPYEFSTKLAAIKEKYGKYYPGLDEDLRAIGLHSWPPTASLSDICKNIKDIQEDGTTTPPKSKVPTAPPAAETMPEATVVTEVSDAISAKITEATDTLNQAVANLKTATTYPYDPTKVGDNPFAEMFK